MKYKAGWNPESIVHMLSAFANDFHNLDDGYVVIEQVTHQVKELLSACDWGAIMLAVDEKRLNAYPYAPSHR